MVHWPVITKLPQHMHPAAKTRTINIVCRVEQALGLGNGGVGVAYELVTTSCTQWLPSQLLGSLPGQAEGRRLVQAGGPHVESSSGSAESSWSRHATPGVEA